MKTATFLNERDLLGAIPFSQTDVRAYDALDIMVWTNGRAFNDSAACHEEAHKCVVKGLRFHVHGSYPQGTIDDPARVVQQLLGRIEDFGLHCSRVHLNVEKAWDGGLNINEKICAIADGLHAAGIAEVYYSGHRNPRYMYGDESEPANYALMAQHVDGFHFMVYNTQGHNDASGEPYIAKRFREGRETAAAVGLPFEPLIGTGRIDKDGRVWGDWSITEPQLAEATAIEQCAGYASYYANGSRTAAGGAPAQDTLLTGSAYHPACLGSAAAMDLWGAPLPEDADAIAAADAALQMAQVHLARARQSRRVKQATQHTSAARSALARGERCD